MESWDQGAFPKVALKLGLLEVSLLNRLELGKKKVNPVTD